MSKKEYTFEENLKRLQELVEDLESGNLPLKESMDKFQKALEIIKHCYEELESSELKIETIVKKDGKIITESFKNK